ncbi:hypothetical protein GCM10017608_19110 [Agromyces luteolus]|uniref:Alpha/beta fold hydrolase n=1 Tax=Agromyces luteolus TaxID=88373 RepID=A0A7C9LFJ8_9MICO|nr:alpha/beta hydrolase [Agromyces luteolus]MUN08010.1 alpha/beta fold hydrolase [Agromyces luteolus]GLK27977.1 hypothetical protein GCM10017608_19110 [Agromyces luteolus]
MSTRRARRGCAAPARRTRIGAAVAGGLLAGLAALAAWIRFGGPRLPAGIDAVIDRVAAGDLAGVVTGTTGETDAGGIRIWYESIPPVGRERGTVLVLISLGGDAILWPPAFLRVLTGAGYRVIRFDQRGTGASDWMPEWDRAHPYTLVDLARDAIAVLDATGTEHAHLIGLSFGGMVAQEVAIAEPGRVASLTLMSTSPDPTDPTLPEPRVGRLALQAIRGLPILKYRLLGDPYADVKERIAKIISVSGPEGVDVEENAALVLYDRRERNGLNLRALRQHQAAVAATRPRAPALATLAVPTLVVHGTDDDLMPFEHGRRLAATIPDAARLWLDGVGHVFPYPPSAGVEGAILAHLDAAGGRAQRSSPI